MEHMMDGFGGGVVMLLWWLIGLGALFFVVYEAVYLAMSRALREASDATARLGAGRDEQ